MERILYVPSYSKETEVDRFFKENYPESISERKPTIIFVSGGDGSMLHAIQDYKYMKVPFFGIAAGTLNFIMNEIKISDFKKDMNTFIKNLKTIETHTMTVRVKRQKSNGTWREVFRSDATNDIVLGNKIMDYHDFKITGVKKKQFSIKGMGILFSTPLGSTAFSYNNNNKIIKNMNKKSILSASIVCEKNKEFEENVCNKIEVSIESTRDIVSLYIDGKTKVFKLKEKDKLKIKVKDSIKISFINIKDFYKKRNMI